MAIEPSPLTSGLSGRTDFHETPRSSVKLMKLPPMSKRRPSLDVVRWFSQQLPVSLTTRHCVVPTRSSIVDEDVP
jgi:hypothetical protein